MNATGSIRARDGHAIGAKRRWRGLAALAASSALLVTAVLVATPAQADNYPSWDDVVAARSSEAAKQAEVDRIEGLISGLGQKVTDAQALATQRWSENQATQTAYNDGKAKAADLAEQAKTAAAKAATSHRQAALIAAQFARTGGNDLSAQLLVDGGKAGNLLYQLGAMSKLSETTSDIYEQATRDENTAKSLSDQADAAEKVLADLAAKAQASLDDAVAAQKTVQDALLEQQGHETELAVQLQALKDGVALTEADYNAGVAAAEEARRQAEEAANAANAGPPPSGAGDGAVAPETPADPPPSDDGGSDDGGDSTPPPVVNPPSGIDGNAVVAYAEQFVGVVPYTGGATPEEGFGCDGLTQYVYGQFGISLPRYVPIQAAAGIRISDADARAGDAVVWSGHIGIYDGDGGVIHAPDYGRMVEHAHSLWGSYYFVRFLP
jgi:cell wall-associated NlpC family hydrolase